MQIEVVNLNYYIKTVSADDIFFICFKHLSKYYIVIQSHEIQIEVSTENVDPTGRNITCIYIYIYIYKI